MYKECILIGIGADAFQQPLFRRTASSTQQNGELPRKIAKKSVATPIREGVSIAIDESDAVKDFLSQELRERS